MKTKIHPTAIVDPKAEIDANVEIGPLCIIKDGVKIAKGTKLLSNVTVEGNTVKIARSTRFQASALPRRT
jgi:UDP-N-acetylglucosamine acyltransferase